MEQKLLALSTGTDILSQLSSALANQDRVIYTPVFWIAKDLENSLTWRR